MATGSELNELKEAITALDKKVDRMMSSIDNLKEKQDDVAKDITKRVLDNREEIVKDEIKRKIKIDKLKK
jgi:peptidoglycan hydrolase CwlO-like protein